MTIYLYVKTHNKTGLKYLGKTSALDPHKYTGSGQRWLAHLRVHGYDYTTQILKECQSNHEIKEWGIYYSHLWNIVESKEWANLRPEEGAGGAPSDEIKKKISQTLKGRKSSPETCEKLSKLRKGKKRNPFTQEWLDKIKIANQGKNIGRECSQETRDKISQAQIGKVISEETKEKLREAWIRRKARIQPTNGP